MRHHGEPAASASPHSTQPGANAGVAVQPPAGGDWKTLSRLLPYLWQYKWRVVIALSLMVGAKLANVSVPLLLKELVDAMSLKPGDPQTVLVVPVALLVGYGALRLLTSAFTELRELVFAKATQGASRSIALQTFEHLHALSLRFHLARQTGGMTRDIERGVRGIESLISYSLYSIIPTLIEVGLVLTILAVKFDAWFAGITLLALALYIFFTVRITEWRTQFRKQANEFDSAAHTRAIDSLLNYETVKYFGNEVYEANRYDESLERLRKARLKSQTSLSLLNTGQQLIIAAALVAMLWRATQGVVDGRIDSNAEGPGVSIVRFTAKGQTLDAKKLIPRSSSRFKLQIFCMRLHGFFQLFNMLSQFFFAHHFKACRFLHCLPRLRGRVGIIGSLNDVLDALGDTDRGDAVRQIVRDLLGAAAVGFVHRLAHRIGDAIGVKNGLAVEVARRTADGLDQ